jgi:two-component system sensor histidine kinase BaeS
MPRDLHTRLLATHLTLGVVALAVVALVTYGICISYLDRAVQQASGALPEPAMVRGIVLHLLADGLLWGSLVAAVMAAALSFLFARLLSRPLREMSAALRAIAQGDYQQRVPVRSPDEVGQLARAFNAMAAQLERNAQLRRELVANVAHELRTPLTSLEGYLQGFLEGVFAPDRERFERMLAETGRLRRLVEDLRELATIEAAEFSLVLRPVELNPLVERAVAPLQPAFARKGITLATVLAPSQPLVRADPDRLQQVLLNLLDNALRYTPAGGRVEVATAVDRDRARITVSDTGPGIAAEHLPYLFERFYRADPSRARGSGGSGLGLAIAKELMERHGGTIHVESAPGQGSRFVCTLPLLPARAGRARPWPAAQARPPAAAAP